MPMIQREELVHGRREEPIVLLDAALLERNLKRWDYTLVVTDVDLVGHYKPDSLAAVSRAYESAVISTARIDPKAVRGLSDEELRLARMKGRILTLALHSLGHLMGLGHSEQQGNAMFNYSGVLELDGEKTLDEDQIARIEREISGTADNRLEETSLRDSLTPVFYARAAWLNWREITDAVVKARPWQFPFRLSRLTAAATSAMLVLLVTAEVWELGTTQSVTSISILSTLAIGLTTAYILVRQKLFVRRERTLLSEQNVVTNIATFSIVLFGMVSTYVSCLVRRRC